MRNLILILAFFFLCTCTSSGEFSDRTPNNATQVSTEEVSEETEEDYLTLRKDKEVFSPFFGSETELNRFIKFLVLPVDAACSGCRDYVSKYISEHQELIPAEAVVIITAANLKAIRIYLQSKSLRVKESSQVVFDDKNIAFREGLIFSHPTFYYFEGNKLIDKVVSTPVSVKTDVQTFFKP